MPRDRRHQPEQNRMEEILKEQQWPNLLFIIAYGRCGVLSSLFALVAEKGKAGVTPCNYE